MNILISTALFLLGIYLAIRVLAALHRIIDLWYTIRTMWPRVLRGLLVWCGGSIALVLALSERYRAALLWGLAAYVAIYIAAFVLWRLMVPRLGAQRSAGSPSAGPRPARPVSRTA